VKKYSLIFHKDASIIQIIIIIISRTPRNYFSEFRKKKYENKRNKIIIKLLSGKSKI